MTTLMWSELPNAAQMQCTILYGPVSFNVSQKDHKYMLANMFLNLADMALSAYRCNDDKYQFCVKIYFEVLFGASVQTFL